MKKINLIWIVPLAVYIGFIFALNLNPQQNEFLEKTNLELGYYEISGEKFYTARADYSGNIDLNPIIFYINENSGRFVFNEELVNISGKYININEKYKNNISYMHFNEKYSAELIR